MVTAQGEVPTDPQVQQALQELRHLTECRCAAGWTQYGRHAPECGSEYRADVDTVTRAHRSRPDGFSLGAGARCEAGDATGGGTRGREGLGYGLTVQRLAAEQGWTPLTLGVLARAYLDDLTDEDTRSGFLTFLLRVQDNENS